MQVRVSQELTSNPHPRRRAGSSPAFGSTISNQSRRISRRECLQPHWQGWLACARIGRLAGSMALLGNGRSRRRVSTLRSATGTTRHPPAGPCLPAAAYHGCLSRRETYTRKHPPGQRLSRSPPAHCPRQGLPPCGRDACLAAPRPAIGAMVCRLEIRRLARRLSMICNEHIS
jgi:hypothetical protein